MADGQYKFSIGLDNTQFEMDIAQAKKAFDSLVKQARQAGAEIDNIPNPFENIGRSAPQVAQATQQFNHLNMATQQLVRELPAASMGFNTFFLAISNNLPIFADQVRNLRQQGTSAVGILKGIGTALFSWQTALVLGVTALSMYGKEIGAWISSLFKGKSAVDAVKEATEGLNAAIEKNGLGIGKELGKYESLRREFESINGDLKEQERFVRDNQKAFDELGISVNDVVEAEAFFSGEGTDAFLTALRLRAEALAAQKLAVEQYEKAIIAETNKANAEIELQSIPQYTPQNKATSGGAYAPMSYGGSLLINSDYTSKKEEIDNLDAEAKSARSVADAYFDMHDAKMKAASDALTGAGLTETDAEQRKKAEKEQREAERKKREAERIMDERTRREKRINEVLAKLRNDATKDNIAAMKDGIEKKIKEINHEYDLEEQAIKKRETELKELRGGTLTEDDTRAIEEARANAEDKRDKDIADVYRTEFAAMQDYLKEYGTFQQRKLAIAEEYAKKIANTDSAAQKQALEKQRDSIMAGLSAEKLNASINWELIFGDLGSMFKEYLRPEFEALKGYMETDEFKNAPASDKQAIVESYSKLESIFGEGGVSFAKLGASVEALQTAQSKLKTAQEKYATSYNELIDAQNTYTAALESGNEAVIERTRIELEKAENAESEARTNVNAAEDNVAEAQNNAATTAHKLSKAFDDTIAGLASFKSASVGTLIPALMATAKGLKQFDGELGNAAGKAFDKLSGKLGGIVQFVFSIIDILKDGISGLVVPILDAVFNAISGIIGDVLNFRDGLFRKIGEALLQGIMSIFESILTMGGLFDWMQFGPDNSKLEKSMANLAEANAALQQAIEKLSEDMDYSEETYKKQMALLNNAISDTANVMYDAANNYDPGALGFIGGTKSTASYVDDQVSASTWKEISELLGKEVASAWDFFSLSASDMLKVAEQLPAVYAEIKSYANDGAYDAAQYMDQYIDYARQIEELQREHTEFLTKTTYDEMKNAFKNALTDMEMSAEDFANSFNKMLVNSMAEALIYQKYQGAINILLGKWAEYMTIERGEKAATLTDEELAHLQLMRDNLYKQIAEDREALDAAFGGDLSGQEAHSKGFQTMSQETGSELNGRFTDIQGQTHRIAEAVEFCRDLHASHSQHLQSISNTLASIHNDTSMIATHTSALSAMKEDLGMLRRAIYDGAI